MTTPARRATVAATALVASVLPALAPGAVAATPPAVRPATTAEGAAEATSVARAADVTAVAGRRLILRWAEGVGAASRAAALGPVGARVVHDLGTATVVEFGDAGRATGAAARLTVDPRVTDVQPDRVVRTATADPGYDQQWGIENTGQTVQGDRGRSGIDVRVLDVWETTRGAAEVVVAIVDSGVDVDHPDLAANLWRNPDEEDNGADDDGNGLPDDLVGWDFLHDDATVFDHADGDSHGTELAGVVAAVADNDIGVTGIAPGVRLMPVKFLENGFGAVSDGLAALRYAADEGADVIVASWIGEQDHPLLRDVIAETNVLVVAPAGNDGRDLSHGATAYPASYTLPNLISVAAVDNRGRLAAFSNEGSRQVDLAAPGHDVLTTDPSTDPQTGGSLAGYAYVSGTSMGAAFTAGAAALALSVNSRLPAAELADLIRLSTRPHAAVYDATITGGLLDTDRLVDLATIVAEPGACHDPPVAEFDDVSRDSVHVIAIDCLVYRGGAQGTGEREYDPRGPVTRAAMATFIHRLVTEAGIEADDPPDAFTDDDGSVHEPSIDAVAQLGIVQGRADGLYGPAEVVSRAQMATMLRRTYDVVLGGPQDASRRWFDDTVDPHADAIDVVRDLGIVSGSLPREYAPAEGVRRDQMATFLVALLDILVRSDVVPPA